MCMLYTCCKYSSSLRKTKWLIKYMMLIKGYNDLVNAGKLQMFTFFPPKLGELSCVIKIISEWLGDTLLSSKSKETRCKFQLKVLEIGEKEYNILLTKQSWVMMKLQLVWKAQVLGLDSLLPGQEPRKRYLTFSKLLPQV